MSCLASPVQSIGSHCLLQSQSVLAWRLDLHETSRQKNLPVSRQATVSALRRATSICSRVISKASWLQLVGWNFGALASLVYLVSMSCFVMDDGTRWERAWMPEAGLPWLRESSWTSVRGGNSDKLEMKLPIYLNVTGVPMSSRMFEFKEERMHRGRMIVVYKERQQGYLDILFRTVREGCRVVAPTLVFSEDKQKVAVVWHSPVTGEHLAERPRNLCKLGRRPFGLKRTCLQLCKLDTSWASTPFGSKRAFVSVKSGVFRKSHAACEAMGSSRNSGALGQSNHAGGVQSRERGRYDTFGATDQFVEAQARLGRAVLETRTPSGRL